MRRVDLYSRGGTSYYPFPHKPPKQHIHPHTLAHSHTNRLRVGVMDKDKEKVITVPTPSMSMSGRVPGPERRSVGDIAPSPSASGKGKSDCANNAGARPVTRAKASPTDDVAALEGGDQDGGGGGGGGPYHPPRANGLWLTAFYLAFNTMATGVFAVPEAYTKLGVGGGSIAVTVIFAICWYTMHRLWALRQSHKE